MAKKNKTFELSINYTGPMDLQKLCDFLVNTMKGHGFKVVEDSFEKVNVDSNKYNYTIKYSGSKDDKPWTKYEYNFEVKIKNYNLTGELELKGELKIDYTNPYKSKNFILKQINGVEGSIYKEKEKYLEEIYKELEKGVRTQLDDEYF